MKSNTRFALLAGVVALAGSAMAQVKLTPHPGPAKERVVYPIEAARIPIGADPMKLNYNDLKWYKFKRQDAQPEEDNWQIAWDNVAWDLAANAHGTTIYGSPVPNNTFFTVTGPTRYYQAPWVADDMQLNPGTGGKLAERSRLRWLVSGTNTSTTLGGTIPTLLIMNSTLFSNTTNPALNALLGGPYMNGWVINFGTMAGGAYLTTLEEGGFGEVITGSGIPFHVTMHLPQDNGGGISLTWATTDTDNNLVPANDALGQVQQWRWMENKSPNDPFNPGTNPSDSNENVWIDDSHPDMTTGNQVYGSDFSLDNLSSTSTAGLPWTELYNMKLTTREWHPAWGMAIDTSTPNSGMLTTNDALSDTLANLFAGEYFDVVACDNNGNILMNGGNPVFETQLVALQPDGSYVIRNPQFTYTDVDLGTVVVSKYIITHKMYLSLRQTSSVITINPADKVIVVGGANSLLSDPMKFGDSDNDNAITLLDYDKFSLYYDKTNADTDWFTQDGDGVAPVDADYDFDGAVTLLDYDIFSNNFDSVGDNDPLA